MMVVVLVDERARRPGGWAVLSIREWILRFNRLGLVSNPLKCIHVAQLEKIKRHRHHVHCPGNWNPVFHVYSWFLSFARLPI
jgi:hypothetical protein